MYILLYIYLQKLRAKIKNEKIWLPLFYSSVFFFLLVCVCVCVNLIKMKLFISAHMPFVKKKKKKLSLLPISMPKCTLLLCTMYIRLSNSILIAQHQIFFYKRGDIKHFFFLGIRYFSLFLIYIFPSLFCKTNFYFIFFIYFVKESCAFFFLFCINKTD